MGVVATFLEKNEKADGGQVKQLRPDDVKGGTL